MASNGPRVVTKYEGLGSKAHELQERLQNLVLTCVSYSKMPLMDETWTVDTKKFFQLNDLIESLTEADLDKIDVTAVIEQKGVAKGTIYNFLIWYAYVCSTFANPRTGDQDYRFPLYPKILNLKGLNFNSSLEFLYKRKVQGYPASWLLMLTIFHKPNHPAKDIFEVLINDPDIDWMKIPTGCFSIIEKLALFSKELYENSGAWVALERLIEAQHVKVEEVNQLLQSKSLTDEQRAKIIFIHDINTADYHYLCLHNKEEMKQDEDSPEVDHQALFEVFTERAFHMLKHVHHLEAFCPYHLMCNFYILTKNIKMFCEIAPNLKRLEKHSNMIEEAYGLANKVESAIEREKYLKVLYKVATTIEADEIAERIAAELAKPRPRPLILSGGYSDLEAKKDLKLIQQGDLTAIRLRFVELVRNACEAESNMEELTTQLEWMKLSSESSASAALKP